MTMNTNDLTISLWNANGLARQAIHTVTSSLTSSSLIFITETWLLSPSRYPTSWFQYHNYATPVENSHHGKMGITLLTNPSLPYPVHILPSNSPYVLSCQVADLLVHCLYLPPTSLTPTQVLDIIDSLPLAHTSSQNNTIICGDFNARHAELLGDYRTTPRGSALATWITDQGISCWNAELAYGQPTYVSRRVDRDESSIIDWFLSTDPLTNPSMAIEHDMDLGSDHKPVCLTLTLTSPPLLDLAILVNYGTSAVLLMLRSVKYIRHNFVP